MEALNRAAKSRRHTAVDAFPSHRTSILGPMHSIRNAATGAGLLAMMLALAAGSVWSVVIQWTGSPAGWVAVPVALLIASAPVQLGLAGAARQSRWREFLLNAAMLTLATIYAQYLGAAGVVGRELGFDFLRTLREIGPELAFALAHERAGALDWLGELAGLALLATFAWLPARLRAGRRRLAP